MITRRTWLFTGTGAAMLPWEVFASDPWKSKEAAEWSDKDIQQVLNHSPWAKEVIVEFKGGMGGGQGRSSRGRGPRSTDASDSSGMGGPPISGGPGGGGGGMGGGGSRGGGGGGMGGGEGSGYDAPQMKATVRWETAKAIRDARKKPVRPEDAPFYVITVGVLPATGAGGWQRPGGEGSQQDRQKEMGERLKQSARIERKGKDPIVPEKAVPVEGPAGRILVFYFPRDPHPIELEDKEVVFVAALGPMEVRARFALKDMVYESKLDL